MVQVSQRIVDISFPLDAATYRNNLPQSLLDRYPGKPSGFEVEEVIGRNSPDSVGQLARGVKMRLHVGSHIDAPEHWIEGGKQIHDLPLEYFMGDAVIANVSGRKSKSIEAEDLEKSAGQILLPGQRLLIRTDWNDGFSQMDVKTWKAESPYLTAAALDWCISKKPVLVGIDFYHGSAPPGTDHGHMFESRLVRSGILTLTNLVNLKAARRQAVTLIAFPLALYGVEASPVRAIVLENTE
jgi:arylformamidase